MPSLKDLLTRTSSTSSSRLESNDSSCPPNDNNPTPGRNTMPTEEEETITSPAVLEERERERERQLSSPSSIAERIRSLIDTLPSHQQPKSFQSKPTSNPINFLSMMKPKHKAIINVTTDESGRPIIPPNASNVPPEDETLLELLNSATIMNGKNHPSRESVWSILDSLGPPRQPQPIEWNSEEEETEDGTSHLGSDDSSIMFYSPLIPSEDSVVELAETALVPLSKLDNAGNTKSDIVGTLSSSYGKMFMSLKEWLLSFAAWPDLSFMWPFNQFTTVEVVEGLPTPTVPPSLPAPTPKSPSTNTTPTPPSDPKPTTPPQVRVWVPSTTKISFQALWWGYRIYLPPPILDILSDQQIETSKRIALLTSSLTWFFTHIPLNTFPPPMQPGMMMARKLVPYVGYIGTFVSWSWSTIKSYDVGYGVFLTATWLLPVALIPGTWQQYDFPLDTPAPDGSLDNPTPDPNPTPSVPSDETDAGDDDTHESSVALAEAMTNAKGRNTHSKEQAKQKYKGKTRKFTAGIDKVFGGIRNQLGGGGNGRQTD